MKTDSLIPLIENLPEDVRQNAVNLVTRMGEVIEGIGDKPVTWRADFLRLVQSTTDRSKLPKGTGAGDLVLGETRLEQPFPFIPIRIWEARQYWNPDQNETNLICSSPDAKVGYLGMDCRTECPYGKWDDVAKKTACNKLQSVIAITSDLSTIFTLNFGKTNYSVGMELKALMSKAGVAPYRRRYALGAKPNPKYKNIECFTVEPLGDKEKVTPEEYLPFLTELFNLISSDREEQLVRFYDFIKTRKEGGGHVALGNNADAELVLIEGSPAAEDTGSADMASKYSL